MPLAFIHQRHRCMATCRAIACFGWLALAASTAGAGESVRALHYGTTLFEFFQQDYFAAITELTAAQQLGRLGEHAAGADLLYGGMALSWGMDNKAESVFNTLLASANDAVDQNQAWFYLGKIAWQRGNSKAAIERLANIADNYDGAHHDEAVYLRAMLQLDAADPAAAQHALARLPPESKWHYYLRYNIGAHYAAQGNWITASGHFDAFTNITSPAPEQQALRDRGLTAAGFAHLSNRALARAADAFVRVRLDGPLSDSALLGYGWALAEAGDYQHALAPWQHLATTSAFNAYAREALLAVPYAQAKLAQPVTALASYQAAAQVYQTALKELAAAQQAFATQPLAELLGLAPRHQHDWLFEPAMQSSPAYGAVLKQLMSQRAFSIAQRELRDLYTIAGHLRRAQERLRVLQHVNAQQQAVWQTLSEGSAQQELEQRRQTLDGQYSALKQKLDDAIKRGDERALATAQQHAHWQRLERAQALAQQTGRSAQLAARLAHIRALLIWQDSENFPQQRWSTERELEQLAALRRDTETASARLASAMQSKNSLNADDRIVLLMADISAHSDHVNHAIAQAEDSLRLLARAELSAQQEQLNRALGQSHLAMAQLFDQSNAALEP
jgi:hypothetical protein